LVGGYDVTLNNSLSSKQVNATFYFEQNQHLTAKVCSASSHTVSKYPKRLKSDQTKAVETYTVSREAGLWTGWWGCRQGCRQWVIEDTETRPGVPSRVWGVVVVPREKLRSYNQLTRRGKLMVNIDLWTG
jgi:hypothetical protein